MVSLDTCGMLERQLMTSPKAAALSAFLHNEEITLPVGNNDADQLFFDLLKNVWKNNTSGFQKKIVAISERQLSTQSPIVYDNYLLFIVIIGLVKFDLPTNWMKKLLALRTTRNEPERSITISLLNILNNNLLTSEGYPPILLAAVLKTSEKKVNLALLQNALAGSNKMILQLEKDLFLTTIYKFSYEYIVAISLGEEQIFLKKFEQTFLVRIKWLQNILYGLLFLAIIFAWFTFIKKYPNWINPLNDLNMLLQLLGVGLLSSTLLFIYRKIGVFLRLFFGYAKEYHISTS